MFTLKSKIRSVVAFVLAMMLMVTPVFASSTYVLIDLGTLGGAYNSQAWALNDNSQLVGYSETINGGHRAFLWDDGVMTDLGTLGGGVSYAYAINNVGQVVGRASTTGVGQHAFIWDDGVMTDLGTFGGDFSYAAGINDAGQVVGTAYTSGNAELRAFLWEDGVMTDLGTLGGNYSEAFAINESGQVVGVAYTAGDTDAHAFLWDDGAMTDLGTLGSSFSYAYGINDFGQVVGFSYTADNFSIHAFLWDDGVMTDLGTFGGDYSYAYGINNAGQVIGTASTSGNTELRAFLWNDGVMVDLGTLGGSYSEAFAINDVGQVVGYAYTAGNAEQHAFLATATPSDITAPVVSPTQSPLANGINWNNTDVAVNWNWSDESGGSGIDNANCTTSSGSSGEGNITLSTTCRDLAGNTGTASYSVMVDKTLPNVSLVAGPVNGNSYYFGSVPAVPTCLASDALSGLNGSCTVSGYSALVGSHTVSAIASDNADNQNSASSSYTVLAWTTNGFFQPVDMGGVWNTVKNGATVPLKFEVFAGSTELTDPAIVVQPLKATQSMCSGGPTDEIELLATGSTSLRYDSTSGQFIYNWKTPQRPGYCYVVTVALADGSTISAQFKLK